MSPESSTEATTTTEAVEAAPVADSVAESAPEQAGEFSVADAFAEAKAEIEAEATPAQDSVPAESTESPETPASETPTPDATDTTPDQGPTTAQGALDRIQTLVAQGRERELSATERGILNRLRTQVQAEAKEQETIRDAYLDLLNKQAEDAEALAHFFVNDPKGPDALTFMREYGRLNPDVSLEHPQGKAATPSPERVRAEVRSEYNQAIEELLETVATDAGLDATTFSRIKGEAQGLGSFLGQTVTEAVKAQIAKELPRIQAEERKAAELEAQAKFANTTMIAPRAIGNGAPSDPRANPSSQVSGKGGIDDWRAAFDEAQAEMARA